MENRFGIKDFLLFGLVGILIVLMVAAMWQYDRQWTLVQDLGRQNKEIAGDLGRIKRQISDGLTVAPGAMPGGGATTRATAAGGLTAGKGKDGATDPFYSIVAASEQPDFARGGWLINNFGTKVGRLTPLVSSDVYQSWIEGLVCDALVYRDPFTLEFMPLIARGWTAGDDGLSYTFKLRDGVTFSDGSPLTADDVKFTFDWIANPDVDAPRQRSYLEKLDKVEVVDPLTVRFTFKEKYYLNFETVALQSVLPRHFYEAYTPAKFNDSTGLLMGSGPYMLESPTTWSPGDGVTLVRNPRYWGERPGPDRLIYKEVEQESVEMVMFGNGDFDILGCTPEQYEAMKKDARVMARSRALDYESPYSGYSYIGWNQQKTSDGVKAKTKFADPRVRKAMTMLVDREAMAKDIFLGYASVADGPFAPTSPQSDPQVKPLPYDVEAAHKLLAEAGYTMRGDVLVGRDGQPLRFTLTYPTGSEIYEKVIRALKDDFARGGVVMDTDPLQWPVLVNKLTSGDFEAITLAWSGSIESDPYQIFSTEQIKDGGDNRTAYSNPELDKLIAEARVTMDTPARMAIWRKVHDVLAEDQPYTFLFNRRALKFMSDRIHNVGPSKVGLNYEALNGGPLPWYFPEGQQKYSQ